MIVKIKFKAYTKFLIKERRIKSLILSVLFLFFTFIFLIIPSDTSAHLAGQPPFFKIFGIYSRLYPVPTSSLSNFNLPQDLAPDNYLINQPLDFQMDANLLPVPAYIVAKTDFEWDFGDGTYGKGLKNTHNYTKIGSYILSITAQYGTEQPALIHSVLINILPDNNYQLPIAVIKINNQKSNDPLTDILKVDFNSDINFDGSDSVTGSSKIVSYFWDFGDEESSNSKVVNHSFSKKTGLSQAFPLLRIKDENGFIADAFVEIEEQSLSKQNNPLPIAKPVQSNPQLVKISTQNPSSNNLVLYSVISIIVIGILLFMARWWLRAHHHGKRR